MPPTGTLLQAIEAYLAAHPMAADSVEGVARWWLQGSGVTGTHQEVEAALETLVRHGRMRRVALADGSTLYCGAARGPGHPPWPM
jgi:hypothetical protein